MEFPPYEAGEDELLTAARGAVPELCGGCEDINELAFSLYKHAAYERDFFRRDRRSRYPDTLRMQPPNPERLARHISLVIVAKCLSQCPYGVPVRIRTS